MAEEPTSSAYLVALGNNRNNARSLGLFAVNANNGLGNANANNWRPRLSFRNREALTCRKALHLNRSHTTQGIQTPDGGMRVRTAVKDLHTTCVSRSSRRLRRGLSGTHSGKGDLLRAA